VGTRTSRRVMGTGPTTPKLSRAPSFSRLLVRAVPAAHSKYAVSLRLGISGTVEGESIDTVSPVAGPGATSMSRHLRNSTTKVAASYNAATLAVCVIPSGSLNRNRPDADCRHAFGSYTGRLRNKCDICETAHSSSVWLVTS